MKLCNSILIAAASLACAVSANAASRPHYGGALRIAVHGSTQTFDPKASDSAGLRSLTQMVFETLVKLDDRGRVQPLLATSWQVEPGNERWRFQIRNGVIFSDGIPVDANVAAASLRLPNPERKVFALGDLVLVETSSPFRTFAANLHRHRSAIPRRTRAHTAAPGRSPSHKLKPGRTNRPLKLTISIGEGGRTSIASKPISARMVVIKVC